MSCTTVVLFKAEINEDECDPYSKIICDGGMKAIVVPTLSFTFVNQDVLQKQLQNDENFIGMILTSNRAVRALHQAFTLMNGDLVAKWRKKQNYCVGESTSKLASTLMEFKMLGEESGNSENLCNLILSTNSNSSSKSFLFPCSSIRKETIPKLLGKEGFHVVEVICYETVSNPYMKDNWEKIVSHQGLPDVLVFFSPSGVHYCHEIVKNSYSNSCSPKYIAIGPSTEKSLIEANMIPCTVAKKPNPESVFEAICCLAAN